MPTYLPKNTEEMMHWYERYVSPLALIAGFLVDNFILLQRIDVWTNHVLLLFYLLLSATGITLINLILTGRLQNAVLRKIGPFLPIVVQFAFGGLFSAYVAFYVRSTGLISSWIFVLLLALLLLGNERFTKSYSQFPFQVTIFFTVLFSFLIFFIPLLLGHIGPLFFLLSGIVALSVMALFMRGLTILMPDHVRANRTSIVRRVSGVFIIFNILYFINAIPPLPLALKDAGVYHTIDRVGNTYMLGAEEVSWHEKFLPGPVTFHRAPKESVFVYSAVFAPTRLSTTIVHEWEHYDETEKRWVQAGTFGFPINGGRDGGYRGYTLRENVAAGKWRVNVKTGNGLLIGRVVFTVVEVPKPVTTRPEEA